MAESTTAPLISLKCIDSVSSVSSVVLLEGSPAVCDVRHMIKEMRHKERLCVLRVLCG